MAGWTGLEPAAFCVTGRRSNQLSYHPEVGKRRNVDSDLVESSALWLFFPGNKFLRCKRMGKAPRPAAVPDGGLGKPSYTRALRRRYLEG